MLFLVLFHSLNAQKAKASQFSTEFSVLSRHCRLESAHAWHNSSELDSALGHSQFSVLRFPFSVYIVFSARQFYIIEGIRERKIVKITNYFVSLRGKT